jgi:hypothetical protein
VKGICRYFRGEEDGPRLTQYGQGLPCLRPLLVVDCDRCGVGQTRRGKDCSDVSVYIRLEPGRHRRTHPESRGSPWNSPMESESRKGIFYTPIVRDPISFTVWDIGEWSLFEVFPLAKRCFTNLDHIWRCQYCHFWCDLNDQRLMEIHLIKRCAKVQM